jgi:primosomal protein N' (replication factor Y)
MRYRDAKYLDSATTIIHERLSKKLRNRVSIPITPSINRIKNVYLKNILIKIEPEPDKINAVKNFIINLKNEIADHPNVKGVRILIDVDPY